MEIKEYNDIFKDFDDVFSYTYEEMPDIDPYIFIHEIKTSLMTIPVRKNIHQVHPMKSTTIKA